ncbi:hypothetical protein QS257_10315 [Terrilactibacillus sp. S3-3]|nr:hypothetical protein QS257_10315 [Terrilactibacillus sp. S3-3]
MNTMKTACGRKKIIGDQTIEYAYDGDANNLLLEVTKKNNQI